MRSRLRITLALAAEDAAGIGLIFPFLLDLLRSTAGTKEVSHCSEATI
jgi:hypothetical protein